jgi:hypothetical protein
MISHVRGKRGVGENEGSDCTNGRKRAAIGDGVTNNNNRRES